MHRKNLQHNEKRLHLPKSWAERPKKVVGDWQVHLVLDIMEWAVLQGAQPFSKSQANKWCFAPTESNEHFQGVVRHCKEHAVPQLPGSSSEVAHMP